MEKICAVIPAYNEAEALGAVVAAAAGSADAVLVVDDGSSYGTAQAAEAAGAVVVTHEVNLGKGQALATGIAWAVENGFDAAVTLDADGQHDPSQIPRFVDRFRTTGADIVLGTRMYNRENMPLVRALTNLVTSIVISCIAGQRITDSQSGYRLLKCATAGTLPVQGARFDAESEILVKAARKGLKITEVRISTIYQGEVSSINAFRDTCRFILLALRLIFLRR
ncbi:MAG: glycosyltransferase family 2 protein [Planctomycetes bacterium]|nr:glycosyltransferase family 2 protein [Planctomycetota bacterium]